MRALVPYVNNRFDLIYVIGEMIGELGNSHTYVGGGDMPDLKPSGKDTSELILNWIPPRATTN